MTTQALRADRAFIVAMRGDDTLTVFSPKTAKKMRDTFRGESL